MARALQESAAHPYLHSAHHFIASDAAADGSRSLGWLPSQPGSTLMQPNICVWRRGKRVRKTSRRDLPAVMAAHADGATTVSATMLLTAHAGIDVFVTGGAFALAQSCLLSRSCLWLVMPCSRLL